jgi:hypothetical protein
MYSRGLIISAAAVLFQGYVYCQLDGYQGDDAAGGLEDLQVNIPGIPGEDYPIYAEVPDTGFSCDGRVEGGYYSDTGAECQAFHICANDGDGGLRGYGILCPNGTLFHQEHFICDWWFNFDCSTAESLYSKNDENAAEAAAVSAAGAGGSARAGRRGDQN